MMSHFRTSSITNFPPISNRRGVVISDLKTVKQMSQDSRKEVKPKRYVSVSKRNSNRNLPQPITRAGISLMMDESTYGGSSLMNS